MKCFEDLLEFYPLGIFPNLWWNLPPPCAFVLDLLEVFLMEEPGILEECRLGTLAMFLNEDRDDVAFLTGSGSSK